MNRITLENGWFDEDAAVKFRERTRHDGHNQISCATGSQWDHEILLYTKSGRWVLNAYSQWQGSTETYTEISENEAARWLCTHGHVADDGEIPTTVGLPFAVAEKIETLVADAEV